MNVRPWKVSWLEVEEVRVKIKKRSEGGRGLDIKHWTVRVQGRFFS